MLLKEEKLKLRGFLKDDLFSGDITSSITPEVRAVATIKCNENCVLAGIEEISFLFSSSGLKVKALAGNGSSIGKGKSVMKISGSNRKILSAERVALNVLGKMSGVATISRQAAKIAEGKSGKRNKTKIFLTRKTTPGFSIFEKKACIDGGVSPHRKNLSDGLLLKENHLVFFGSIENAVKAARKKYKGRKIEIEAETEKEEE